MWAPKWKTKTNVVWRENVNDYLATILVNCKGCRHSLLPFFFSNLALLGLKHIWVQYKQCYPLIGSRMSTEHLIDMYGAYQIKTIGFSLINHLFKESTWIFFCCNLSSLLHCLRGKKNVELWSIKLNREIWCGWGARNVIYNISQNNWSHRSHKNCIHAVR